MKKIATFTMDVEDWFDTEYLIKRETNKNISLLDGVEEYLKILESYNISGTFFTLTNVLEKHSEIIKKLDLRGHEIALHGFDHIRPVFKSVEQFKEEILLSKKTFETLLGHQIYGYRAPCYSLDEERLKIIIELGFYYDSSKIVSDTNSRYSKLNIANFKEVIPGIYKNKNFLEFEISSEKMFTKRVTIAGGGFFRIFPWFIIKHLLKKYFKNNNYFVFFIHPYEVSSKRIPYVKKLGFIYNLRLRLNKKNTKRKIIKLIEFLKKNDFEFSNFINLYKLIENKDNK